MASIFSFSDLELLFERSFGRHRLHAIRDRLILPKPAADFADAPERILIILFSSRSGSTYAGRLLANTPYFEAIGEYFNPPELARIRHEYDLPDDGAAAAQVLGDWSSRQAFGAKCGGPGIIGALYSGFLPALLDRIAFISLRRRDTVAQAVSMAKAKLSGQYHSTGRTRREVRAEDYDQRLIAGCLMQIRFANRQLEHLASALPNISPEVQYEDVAADPQGFVNMTLDLLDLPRIGKIDTKVDLKVMRNTVNAEWTERFHSEMHNRQMHYFRTAKPLTPAESANFDKPRSLVDTVGKWIRRRPQSREDFLRLIASHRGLEKTRAICRAIPIRSVGGFDVPGKILCILATPRSGASRTAELLRQAPYFNTVCEAFVPFQLDILRGAKQFEDYHETAQHAIDIEGTAHAFGMKGGLDLLAAAAHVGFLHDMIGRISFVRLRRRDLAAQAAELLRRETSDYNPERIERTADAIRRQNESLDTLLAQFGKTAPTLWFEDECGDPQSFADKLCGAAQLPVPVPLNGEAMLVPDVDPLAHEWAERFRATMLQ